MQWDVPSCVGTSCRVMLVVLQTLLAVSSGDLIQFVVLDAFSLLSSSCLCRRPRVSRISFLISVYGCLSSPRASQVVLDIEIEAAELSHRLLNTARWPPEVKEAE